MTAQTAQLTAQTPAQVPAQPAPIPAQMTARRKFLVQAVFGLAFGYSLSRIGFGDFQEVNRMFTLADPRLYFTFCGGVAIAAAGFAALGIRRTRGAAIHPSVVVGGLLFGSGWAITGTCPSIAVVQVGEGRLWGVATLLGVIAGTWLYGKIHARYFRWDPGSCAI